MTEKGKENLDNALKMLEDGVRDVFESNKFQEVLDGVFRLRIKMLQRTRWLTPVMHVILSVGIGLAIWFGSYLILNGSIKISIIGIFILAV